jgi:hypothetical protein
MVSKLKRSIYCLNKSPRMWHQNFDIYILGLGFVRSEDNLYSKEEIICFIYVCFYVDDIMLVGNNMVSINHVKMQISYMFDMKDIGVSNFIMIMDIKRY